MLSLGALPPVDAGGRIVRAILLELPEILPRSGAAAAMHAHIERIHQMFGREDQGRQGLNKPFRVFPLIYSSKGVESEVMTSSIVMFSARAA